MTTSTTLSTDHPAEPLPVLIIGAGLGGLNLANSLAKHHIPYRLFERDASPNARLQGYRISMNGGGHGGVDGLEAALTPELYDEFVRTCGEQHFGRGGRVGARTGELEQRGVWGLLGAVGWYTLARLAGRFLGKRAGRWGWQGWVDWWYSSPILTVPAGKKQALQVDRQVLRSILLTDQTPHITFSSAFKSFTTDADSVTAHFADGTSATGSLLVGADGIHSKVARQLIGGLAEPQYLGMRVVYGKTPLTPEVEEKLNPALHRGASFVVDRREDGKATMIVEAMRFDRSSHRVPDDYIFWALSGLDGIFHSVDYTDGADGLVKETQRLSKDWDPSVKVIIDEQARSQLASLPLRSSNPDGTVKWDTNPRVTVLGDAIHCMPPTGGQGANSALYDAALLGMALKASGEDGRKGWSKETIARYEEGMRYNIGDVVGMACIGAEGLLGSVN